MKIGIYQFYPKFGDKEGNLSKIEHALSSQDADIIVLPELALTGYLFISKDDLYHLGESAYDGPSVKRLQKLSHKHNIHIVTGFLEREEENFYNSALLIYPSGKIGIYRKVHLFFEETLFFTPGNLGFPVFDIGGVKIGIMVCFDWIYPESARTLAINGADIIAHPSNLVLPYCQDAMITRSIENKVFTITANRFGTDKRDGKTLSFTGKSQIVSPKGERLLTFSQEEEGVKIIRINPKDARDKHINLYNDLLGDRKVSEYNI